MVVGSHDEETMSKQRGETFEYLTLCKYNIYVYLNLSNVFQSELMFENKNSYPRLKTNFRVKDFAGPCGCIKDFTGRYISVVWVSVRVVRWLGG